MDEEQKYVTDEEMDELPPTQDSPTNFEPNELYGEDGAAFDPAMPKALAAYWRKHPRGRLGRSAKSGGGSRGRHHKAGGYYHLYDPHHRSRGHHKKSKTRVIHIMDPRRRPRTKYRIKHVVHRMDPRTYYKRHTYDPAFMFQPSNFWGAVLQPILTTVGGIAHNILVSHYPKLAGGVKVGQGAVGYLGLAGGVIGAALDTQNPPSVFGKIANDIGSGFLTEAVNVPALERVSMAPTQNAFRKGGMRGAARLPGTMQSLPSMQPGTF